MCIWKNRNDGCLVGYTMSICATICLCMWPLWGRRNMTGWFAMAGQNSQSNEASTRRLPPWCIDPNFTWEEIQGLYQELYQLQRLCGGSHCEEATEEWLQEEILASIRECLWLCMPPEDEGEHPSSTPPWRDSWTEYHNSICGTHKRLTAGKQGQDNEILAFSRDAHWKALVAATLLEEGIERLGYSTSRQCSQSHQCSRSCQHSNSWCQRSRVCQGRDSQPMSPQSDSNLEASPPGNFSP